MTIETLSNEFNISIQLDDNNRMHSSRTPIKGKELAQPATPDTLPESPVSSSDLSVSSLDSEDQLVSTTAAVTISEHKLAELEGRHMVEPLLKENPSRFVLFPIEDNEVSMIIWIQSQNAIPVLQQPSTNNLPTLLF